jgi:hypothetical protein
MHDDYGAKFEIKPRLLFEKKKPKKQRLLVKK